jgi:hypothetical protein
LLTWKDENMMTGKEQLIREAAYRIWEEEGHPTGDADRHWEMAARRIEAADGESARSPLDSKANLAAAGAAPLAPVEPAPAIAAKKREPPVKPKPGKRTSPQQGDGRGIGFR